MHEFQEREEQEERRAARAPADGPRRTAVPLPSATVGPGGQLLQGEQQEQMEERPLPSATVGPGGQLLQGEQREQVEERRAARAPADGPRGTAGPLPSATVGPGGQLFQRRPTMTPNRKKELAVMGRDLRESVRAFTGAI
jgi:hypothetical protein